MPHRTATQHPQCPGSATPGVRYGNLSRQARETVRQYPGLRIAGYIRHCFPDGAWRGDACGCPDDRCIGFHHDREDGCQCLPVVLGEYAEAAASGGAS